MKKIITGIFLFISFIASAQNKATVDTTTGPVITKEGKPEGEKTEIKVTKDGGSIQSSDGKLELIIPEGAVSKKTLITIQPVANLMNNGSGKAYHLEPAGIQFEKPLQLIIHYDEEEIKDSTQLLLGIAMQDETGQWFGLNEPTLDTIAKTISGNINHFSTWAAFEKLKLITTPPRTSLKVKHSVVLAISGVDGDNRTPQEKQDEESKMSPEKLQQERNHENRFKEKYGNDVYISPLRKRREPMLVYWYVNAVWGGNAVTGTLDPGVTDGARSQYILYTAPNNVPDQNPVAITARLIGLRFLIKGVEFRGALTTSILIYDNAYEVTMISKMDASAGSILGHMSYLDSGSLVVNVSGNKTKIIQKLNRNALSRFGYAGQCKPPVVLKRGSGNIHIFGSKSINVIPGSTEAEPPTVDIWFIPAPTIPPLLQLTCPDQIGGWHTRNTAMENMFISRLPAFPQQIKFVAKEGEQVVQEVNMGGIYYKATVRKLKDDE